MQHSERHNHDRCEAIVWSLEALGVSDIFGIPGGNVTVTVVFDGTFEGLLGCVFGRFTLEFAIFHSCVDFGDVLQDDDVFERVAVDQDQIGVEAGQDLAEFVGRQFRSVALRSTSRTVLTTRGLPCCEDGRALAAGVL